MDIGKVIKRLRQKRKISQQKLSKTLGITQGYLSLIERGDRVPGIDFIKKTADCLNIPSQLIFLMACESNPKLKRFSKSLRKLTSAVDDILRTAKI